MEDFRRALISKTKTARLQVIKKMKAYQEKYLPMDLYGKTKVGRNFNEMILTAEGCLDVPRKRIK